ncbi:MAG: PilZ domain-containing protein [Deltaproteobacteria bacterium]|nr:PilZ domain-containing protein [Deltaproteobacteria bacterium]
MEVEYLKNRRIHQRINDANVIVYYKTINSDSELNSNEKANIKKSIFDDKVSRLNAILRSRGAGYEPIINTINAKVNKLTSLINSFANPEMKIAELSAVNLSVSGIRFRTRSVFREGDRVELLMIFMPRVDLVDCRCEVVRVIDGRDDHGDYYDIAVKYIILDKDDEHKIVNYVKITIESGPF